MPSLLCNICDKPMRVHATSTTPDRAEHLACKQSRLEPYSAKPTLCAHCGGPFESKRRAASKGGRWIRCCSKSCARRYEITSGVHSFQVKPRYGQLLTDDERTLRTFQRGELSRRKRRARLASVERETYTKASIAERDGFICHLCNGVVDMAVKFPEPLSASVDHVIPLSLGGNDKLENVALAHLDCNLRKHNRI